MFYSLNTTWQFVFLLFGLAAFASVAWKKPVWGGWLVIFFTPLYLLKIGSWPMTVLEALIWVFVLARLIKDGAVKEKVSAVIKNELFWPVALILAGVIISTVFSPDPKIGLGILKAWFLAPIAFALVFSAVSEEKGGAKIFFSALIASCAAVAAIGIIYLFFGRLTFDGRLTAFYLSPNHLAMYLVPGFIAGFGLYFYASKSWHKFLLFIIYCLLLIVLYATYSYGAWLGLLAAGIFVLFCLWKYKITEKNRLFLVSCFLFLVFAAVFFSQIYGAHSDKLTGLFSSSRSSWQSRLMIWGAAGRILKDNWLLGIGPGAFQQYYLAYQKYFSVPYLEWAAPQPQNIFLAWWLQAGLLGAAGFVWLLATFFRRGFIVLSETKSLPVIFLMAVMAYILVHGLADTTFWKNDLSLVFWLIVFLSCRAGRRAY